MFSKSSLQGLSSLAIRRRTIAKVVPALATLVILVMLLFSISLWNTNGRVLDEDLPNKRRYSGDDWNLTNLTMDSERWKLEHTGFERSLYLLPATIDRFRYFHPKLDIENALFHDVLKQIDGMREDFSVFYHDKSIKPSLSLSAIQVAWNGSKSIRKEPERRNKLYTRDASGPTLVIYSYVESQLARANLEFFFRHHNPAWADVLLVTRGGCSANVPDYVMVHNFVHKSVQEVCTSLRTWAWILEEKDTAGNDFVKPDRWKRYEFFFLLNSKTRGPFYPLHWSPGRRMDRNWLDIFREPLSDEVGIVGASLNCMHGLQYLKHLQVLSLMTHRSGLELIYKDLEMRSKILNVSNIDICGVDEDFRVESILIYEIGVSQSFISRGIGVHVLLAAWQLVDILDHERLISLCFGQVDSLYPNSYFGSNVHPAEMIFQRVKSSSFRRIDMDLVDLFTVWFDQRVAEYPWKLTYKNYTEHSKVMFQ